jgi:hypothetical protein
MHGINLYDYGARHLALDIPRFTTVDPLAEKYYGISPYAYVLNNPINYIDPDGEIPILSGLIGFFRGLGSGGLKGGFQTAWKTEKNAWKLLGGLFIADKEKNMGGKIGQIFSRLTWELPQTLGGYLTSSVANMAYDSDVSYYAGATVTKVNNQDFGGITLGSYILGDKEIGINPNNSLFQHEFGHTLQSRVYGPSYLFLIGIPSLISASTNDYWKHADKWFEQNANKRSLEYWQRRGTNIEWDNYWNPINAETSIDINKIPSGWTYKDPQFTGGKIIWRSPDDFRIY